MGESSGEGRRKIEWASLEHGVYGFQQIAATVKNMKIAVIIVRILVGLLFLFASITYFFNIYLGPVPEMSGKMKTFNEGLAASGYIMTVVKTFELLCGLAFVSGRFVALAVVVIFPIAVNILLVHVFLQPEGLTVAIPLFIGILFLAYAHREKYAAMFAAK